MRITIEPTSAQKYPQIQIEHPSDDLPMEDVVTILRAALIAWGYDEATVNEYLPKQ